MKKLANREERPQNQRSVFASLIALALVVLIFGFLFANTLYEETLGKQNLILRVQSFQFGVLNSDYGTFKLYEPSKTRTDRFLKRQFDIDPIDFLFWRDRAKTLRAELRIGCHYEVTVINSMFDDHPIGVNRMPPQTTVVKVVRQVDSDRLGCDMSAQSGKPTCRWDQVKAIKGKGIGFPEDTACDFETFLKVRSSLPGKPDWEQ